MRRDSTSSEGPRDRAGEPGLGPLPPVDGTVRHLYVHAPFCARRCVYCDFAVHVDPRPAEEAWQEAVGSEWRLWRDNGVRTSGTMETVYVGGGTPSLLPEGAMTAFAQAVGAVGGSRSGLEWTAEANPESFTDDIAREWGGVGVNRISLGAQTFSSPGLKWMGRLHAPEDVARALGRARTVGIENVSVDLILGLPDSVPRSWQDDLDRVLGLDVPHISLYGLTVEAETPLARQILEGRTEPPSDGRYRDEFLHAAERLSSEGYVQYEISNFARPGFESRHNQAYWSRTDYLGLGNGAHSFVGGVRWWNDRSWEGYRDAVRFGRSPVVGWERPSPDQSRLERLWLGLRTSRGLEAGSLTGRAAELATGWISRGLARRTAGRLTLTPEGWLLTDELVADLDRAFEESPGTDANLAPRETGGR